MKVALCAIVKNEERDVLEWLLYHTAIGFDTIVLYDNGSEDRTYDFANRAKQFGDIRPISWPAEFSQLAVYKDCCDQYGNEFDWICYLDCDEFLVPVRDRSVRAYLEKMSAYSAVAVNWVHYGSSGKTRIPEGLVVDNFLYRGLLNFSNNRHVKSLLRPEAIQAVKNPHFCSLRSGHDYVDALGRPCQWLKPGKLIGAVGLDVIRINHYFTKSREHYQVKLKRGNADSGVRTDRFDRNDCNDEFDPAISELFGREIRVVKEQLSIINKDVSL